MRMDSVFYRRTVSYVIFGHGGSGGVGLIVHLGFPGGPRISGGGGPLGVNREILAPCRYMSFSLGRIRLTVDRFQEGVSI